MGNWCCLKRQRNDKVTLLLVGLDNAGKTVAAKNLAGESPDAVVPTVGFSVVNLKYRGFKVSLFDLGGSSDFRNIWEEYFVYAHGVIYVVDSSDIDRLEETKEALQHILSHKKISGKPILLLANKQDEENALDEIDLVEKLQLEQLVNNNKCPTLVETCCAELNLKKNQLDVGIKKGYRWLMNYITNNYETINKRVSKDVIEHEEQQKQKRNEIIKRMQLLNQKELEIKNELNNELLKQSQNNQNNGFNDIFVMKQESNDRHCDSSDEDLIHIYHIKNANENKRPKSAVKMVKEQLEMEEIDKKVVYKKIGSNKTAPLSLKLPQSAKERKQSLAENRRTLKSAGDSIFIVSDLPNSVQISSHGDDFHTDLFVVNNFEAKKKLPPLKVNRNVTSCKNVNGINIVEV